MKMPLNWMKEFVDFDSANLDCTPHQYAEAMTMSGSKVEGFQSEADSIKNVVIGKVLSIVPHPDSDHMVITQIDIGQDQPVQIVTGANNLTVGDLVPAALHKSLLPGGKEIRKGKLRGVESNGMLCSLSELGLSIQDFPHAVEDGIFVLDEEYPVGTPAVQALGLDDTTVEFEITPNRPDCLSIRGLARETAATFRLPFVAPEPQVKAGHGDVNSFLKVRIDNSDLCYRYVGAVVENVRVKPSPRWLRQRLRMCGVRPINNLVDITNYVMLEYGQPMHCFDYRYVTGGEIIVRNAQSGEEIQTLDGVNRSLSNEMLVIADQKSPIAVAGVMGGEFSGVYQDTTTVIFESAMFHGPSVRTTAKKLGMRTESSGRYEKGLDPNGCLTCLQYALQLVQQLDAGDVVNGVIDIWPHKRETRKIPLQPDSINKLLGITLSKQEMTDILLPLGFTVENDMVIVPSNRWDMERSCDIAEEIARFVGYNKIPSTVMRGVAQARPTPYQIFTDKVMNTLVGYGFYQCETFSFYSPKAFDMICLEDNNSLRQAVVISNPLGEDTSIMRTTALPSILEVVARNYNARLADCPVFEMATEYMPNPDPQQLPIEMKKVVAAAYGENWDYLAIKGVVEQLLSSVGITDWAIRANTHSKTWHPGRTADIYLVQYDQKRNPVAEIPLATFGELHPTVLSNYGIKPRVVAMDIYLDSLFQHRKATALFQPLPKHPASTRDLALVADLDTPAAEIAATLAISSLPLTGLDISNISLTAVSTAVLIPFLSNIGFAPAVTFFNPSLIIA